MATISLVFLLRPWKWTISNWKSQTGNECAMCNLHFTLRYLEDHPIGALANLLNLVEVFQPVACLAWGHPFSRDFLWSTMLDWFLLLYKICLLIYWSRVRITITPMQIHGQTFNRYKAYCFKEEVSLLTFFLHWYLKYVFCIIRMRSVRNDVIFDPDF